MGVPECCRGPTRAGRRASRVSGSRRTRRTRCGAKCVLRCFLSLTRARTLTWQYVSRRLAGVRSSLSLLPSWRTSLSPDLALSLSSHPSLPLPLTPPLQHRSRRLRSLLVLRGRGRRRPPCLGQRRRQVYGCRIPVNAGQRAAAEALERRRGVRSGEDGCGVDAGRSGSGGRWAAAGGGVRRRRRRVGLSLSSKRVSCRFCGHVSFVICRESGREETSSTTSHPLECRPRVRQTTSRTRPPTSCPARAPRTARPSRARGTRSGRHRPPPCRRSSCPCPGPGSTARRRGGSSCAP